MHSDHLSTPRVITNEAGAVVWKWLGDAFGDVEDEVTASGSGIGLQFNLRFPGQYFDRESGTHYNYFRDYEPAIGRYIQADPIGLVGGLNTYAYVEGNPMTRVAPSDVHTILLLIPFFFDGPFGPSCGPAGSRLATWTPDGKAKRSCDNHDACYADKASGKSQEQCDKDFKKDMEQARVNPLLKHLYYCSVVKGGEESFRKARR